MKGDWREWEAPGQGLGGVYNIMIITAIINWMPKMSQVFYIHYLLYPLLELYELRTKKFDLHIIYLEGLGIHWRLWRSRVAWSDLWNATSRKERCQDQENHGIVIELSVHRAIRPERRKGTRIHGRKLKVGIVDGRPEPEQRPEPGSGASLKGDQEEFFRIVGI